MTCEKLGNVDLLSVERVRAEKIDLYDLVDEFDSRHDNRRIKQSALTSFCNWHRSQ